VKLLYHCGALAPGERVYIVCDSLTELAARSLESCAKDLGIPTSLSVIQPLAFHGAEPPSEVASRMLATDLVCAMTTMSLAHTRARLAAAARGVRMLSLPDYSLEVLESVALTADFRGMSATAETIAARLTEGSTLHVVGTGGTDIVCSIHARRANAAPGWVRRPGDLASPPDAEVNIAPVEGTAEGRIVVDGSIPAPQLGLLCSPITIEVQCGRITAISGKHSDVLRRIIDAVDSCRAGLLAEVGWGLNDKASLSGSMLADEGAAGTAHFGFGSNLALGGTNDVPFHLDCIVREVSTTVDGRWVTI
jgi:2,5-dihydroxypyridine 5,6-dioxygenase